MSLFKGLKKAVKKVGKALKPIVKAVAPIAAGILPGPFGTIASIAVGAQRSAAPPVLIPDLAMNMFPSAYAAGPKGLPVPRRPTVPATRDERIQQIPRTVGPGGTAPPSGYPAGARVRDTLGRILKQTPVGWLPRVGRAAAAAAGWIAVGSYFLDASGNVVGVRTSRRMNPLNHRALRRAIRRVKGATKICREVERITGSRTRRASSSRRGRASAEAACR